MTVIIGTIGFLAAFWLLAAKISILRVLGYELWIDIVLSIALFFVFIGTTSGAIIAVLGGAFISVTLAILKKIIGFERFDFRTRQWVYHAPKWTRIAKLIITEINK